MHSHVFVVVAAENLGDKKPVGKISADVVFKVAPMCVKQEAIRTAEGNGEGLSDAVLLDVSENDGSCTVLPKATACSLSYCIT